MRDKFYFYLMIIFSICISIILIFSFGSAMNIIVDAKSLEAYSLMIAFIGLFTTFLGAYLGAKLSGEYTLKASQMIIDEQNKIALKRAKFLTEDLFSESMSSINKIRPFDFGFPINEEKFNLNLNPTFREIEYEYVQESLLKDFKDNIDELKNFRLTTDFYLLSPEFQKEITNTITQLSKLYQLFQDLNSYLEKDINESDMFFVAKKKEFHNTLDILYMKRHHILKNQNH
ncbi:hypothetical protein RW115_11285 [Macrococcus capreoli]|uniref:hypothetical protein n=1 Tax=Macrococcus capreoli TaxID=2982690 RepID=UPI0021D57234|nr:hypothetical protein [Macrococcus sp. TMW 2.2395]MCU7557901.1 hypothetical protein [Macrococcus sp. TMW 2.2395]